MKLITNPEYEELVPKVSDIEYQSLKESIKQNGLWIPIITNDNGIILDGHHRFRVCRELGIRGKNVIRTFENPLLEKKFVIESNLQRRQLNDFQKSEIGLSLLKIEQEFAKQRQGNAGNPRDLPLASKDANGKSVALIGKKIGVKCTTFERAKKVIENAPESVKQDLRLGKTTISKQYRNIRKQEKRDKRQQCIKEIQVNLPKTVTLYNSEFQSIPIPENSVSLIMTDPPYAEKCLSLYDDLAKHASKTLREGGSLITYAGHFSIGKIIHIMEKENLSFQWPIAVIHSGPSASVFSRKILVGYKPMLWFVKGTYDGKFVRDTIQSKFQGKELHEWAQSTVESDYYIKHLTIENEIVYDPFMGQGTFGISAVNLKRQFIGVEPNITHFRNAEKMISHASQLMSQKLSPSQIK